MSDSDPVNDALEKANRLLETLDRISKRYNKSGDYGASIACFTMGVSLLYAGNITNDNPGQIVRWIGAGFCSYCFFIFVRWHLFRRTGREDDSKN